MRKKILFSNNLAVIQQVENVGYLYQKEKNVYKISIKFIEKYLKYLYKCIEKKNVKILESLEGNEGIV